MRPRNLALVILCVVLLGVAGAAVAQDGASNAALAFIAEKHGVSADGLDIIYQMTTDTAAMGKVTYFKAIGRSDGSSYGAVVDESGKAWLPEEFRAASDQAYLARYGKMDLQLFSRFEKDAAAVIPVEIWLVVDDSLYAGLRGPDFVGAGLSLTGEAQPYEPQGDRFIPNAAPAAERQPVPESVIAARQAVNDHVAALQTAVVARLADKGITLEARAGAPILAGTLSRDQVVLAGEDPDVGRVYAGDMELQDMNNSATNTAHAPGVWGRGYTGVGAQVAILEDSRPYLNFWFYSTPTVRNAADPNMDSHATQTMGNVLSSHGDMQGMARGATMYAANATTYNNSDLQAAGDWAIAQGADVINNSWGPNTPTGCLDTMGRYFDYKVVVNAPLVTHAAGNSGNLMGDQAMAYNILSVGSIDDNNGAGWSDDSMSSFSAWNEGASCSPSNGDRQEPDVVATGQRIRSTRIHPPSIDSSNQQGTSYSSPMVAGVAALMIDVDAALVGKPEAMRALMMANAIHNIEGSSARSEYDGAGSVDAYSTYLSVLNAQYSQQTINPSTWTQYEYSFYGVAGNPVACVAVWTSHPNASYTDDPLLSDLDLALVNPSGTSVLYSSSVNNNVEIIRATLGVSGTWKCRVYKWSSSTTWEYLGVGVSTGFQFPYSYPE